MEGRYNTRAGLRYRARTQYVPIRSTYIDGVKPVKGQNQEIISVPEAATAALSLLDQSPPSPAEVLRIERPSRLCIQPEINQGVLVKNLVGNIQHNAKQQSFDASLEAPKPVARLKKRNFTFMSRTVAAGALMMLLVMGGTTSLIVSLQNNKKVITQVQGLTRQAEQNESAGASSSSSGIHILDENQIPETVIHNYSVSPEMPRYVSIPKLGIKNTRILRMGLDNNGSIKTPNSIFDAGWYEGSSSPNDTVGSALIMAHVSGVSEVGVFYNLFKLQNGDEINIEMGDGTLYVYRVVAKEEAAVDEINMNRYLVSKDVDKPGITLMTCAGEFNPETQQYENRLAVFAVRDN